MTQEELDAIEARAAKATALPWNAVSDHCHYDTVSDIVCGGEIEKRQGIRARLLISVGGWANVAEQEATTAFIAAARQDVPALVAEVRRLREAQQWRTMDSAPKDGSRFLAETLTVADEYDEYDRLLKKGVRTRDIVVAYYLFGGFVSYPFNGAVPMNVYYTAWQPLPTPQVQS